MQSMSFGDRPSATFAQIAKSMIADLAAEENNEEKRVIYNSNFMHDIIHCVKHIYVAKHRLKGIETSVGRFIYNEKLD